MWRALTLAERGRGKTSPNPMVGAVIVSKGRIIAEGYHRKAGTDHAEVAALKRAGKAVGGATIYVTLEPCCHTGNTGPCSTAIIQSGIRRVVYAVQDPDPRVKGRGTRQLRQAGLIVDGGCLRDEAVRLNEHYIWFHRNRRPFVILKMAQTLDGRIATSTGDSRWISGKPARKLAHRLRSEVDAVVVGMGTVRTDNPALTVRHVNGKNPYRIVLANRLNFPTPCRLLEDNTDFKTVVASNKSSIERFSRQPHRNSLIFWTIKKDRRGHLDLHDFIAKAEAFGLQSLLIEGGSALATSAIRAGLVDKYVFVTAPKLVGRGREMVGDLGIKKLSEAVEFSLTEFELCGQDTVFTGYAKRKRS